MFVGSDVVGQDWNDDSGTPPDSSTDAAVEASPSCQSVNDAAVCAPTPPGTWKGPIIVYEGPSSTSAPACPSGLPLFRAHTGLDAGAAICTPCACQVQSASCTAPILQGDATGVCTNLDQRYPLTNGQCVVLNTVGLNEAAVVPSSPDASLTASGGDPTLPPATWGALGEGCAAVPAVGACPSGDACLKYAPQGFLSGKFCVYTPGDTTCPGAPYGERHVYYTGLSDNRGCSTCGCALTGGSCNTVGDGVTLYWDPGCSDSLVTLQVPSACSAVASARSAFLTGNPTPLSPPTADISGGKPTGSASGTNATTVCCTP